MTALASSSPLFILGADILTNAVETGAIGYWLTELVDAPRDAELRITSITFTAEGVDDDDSKRFTVTPDDIIKAMRKVRDGKVRINSELKDWISGDLKEQEYINGDALTDDALVQIAAFDSIVFG